MSLPFLARLLLFFGVRQCFALPLWFFLFFCFSCFCCDVRKNRTKNTKNQSGRAKHCRTPKREEGELRRFRFIVSRSSMGRETINQKRCFPVGVRHDLAS